jgi:hypothetical protein
MKRNFPPIPSFFSHAKSLKSPKKLKSLKQLRIPTRKGLLIFFFLSIFLAFSFFLLRSPVRAAWFNQNWAYRKSIPVTNNTTAETNVYIIASVNIGDATKAQTDDGDFRFTLQNGQKLQYFVYTGIGSTAPTFHIKIPSLITGTQTIYAYFGNPSSENGFQASDFTGLASNYTVGTLGNEEKSEAPIAHWKFDEGYGGSANDSSSQGNNAALGVSYSSPTWITSDQCLNGKCLKFDGANNYLSAPDNNSLEMRTGNATYSFWIRTNTTTLAQIITKRTISIYDYDGPTIAIEANGTITSALVINHTAYLATTTTAVNDNKWHLVTTTYNRSSNLTIYIDGILDKTADISAVSGTDIDTTAPLNIGRRELSSGAHDLYFKGYLDDVKIFNYTRSSDQIKTDYNSGKSSSGGSKGSNSSLGAPPGAGGALSNGLVGYWKMDEASWNGTANEVLDASGNSNNGTANGGSTTTTGKYGNGGVFSGSNQSVDITHSAELNPSTDMSVSMWVKFNINNDWMKLVSKSHGSDPWKSYEITYNGWYNRFDIQYYDSNGTSLGGQSTQISPTINTWYHVVVERVDTTFKFFINGEDMSDPANTSTVTATIYPATSNLSLGSSLNGNMDEVRIYNRALSAQEVSALYAFTGAPIAHWNMEEGSGTTVNDTSGNANTGTLGTGSSAPSWISGKIGKALNFDGNDYVGIGTTISGVQSIAFWVNPRSLSTSLLDLNGTNYVTLVSGTITVNNISSPTIYVNGKVSSSISLDSWQFVEITTATPITASLITLGKANSTFLNGKLDDIRLYNYARSAKENTEDLNSGHPAPGSPVGSALLNLKFDEGYGGTAHNSGNAGSTLNGTLSGATTPTWSSSGKFGKALLFNGINSYLSVIDNSAINFGTTKTFSISTWIKTSSSATQRITSKFQLSGGWYIYLYNSRIYSNVTDGVNSAENYLSTTTLNDNAWHHVLVTYTNGESAVGYIDGKQEPSFSISTITGTMDNGENLSIGGQNQYFSGLMDEFKIYNFALSSNEIKQEYNKGQALLLGSVGTDSSGNAQFGGNWNYCPPGDGATCVGPVGEWNFEEGSGTTVNDTSGNSNTGILDVGSSAPTWTTGKIGKALNFNGTSNYINAGTLPQITGASQISAEAWIKPTTINPADGEGRILSRGASNDILFQIITGGKLNVYINNGGNFQSDANAISANTWQHVAFTWETTTDSVVIYVNGKAVKSGTIATSTIINTGNTFIGRYPSSVVGLYQGSLDSIRIYNYARTPAQVAWDYNNGKPVAWWKMNECQGTTINDSSGNGNTGTLTIGTGVGSTQDAPGTCTDGINTNSWSNGANGKYNASLNFDGVDDFISIPGNAMLRPNQLTISAWINPSATNSDAGIAGTWSHFTGYILWLDNINGSINFALHSGGPGGLYLDSNIIPTAGNWYHIVGTYDGSNANLYINGSFIDSQPHNGTNYAYPVNFEIGRYAEVADTNFAGQIDDVQLYNYALTAQQIKLLYNQNSAVRFGPSTGIP